MIAWNFEFDLTGVFLTFTQSPGPGIPKDALSLILGFVQVQTPLWHQQPLGRTSILTPVSKFNFLLGLQGPLRIPAR